MPCHRLGELVEREPDYGSGQRSIPLRGPDDVKYIRITDFDDNGLAPANEFVTAEIIDDRYRLADGDVLFARSGATAGKTFIYSCDIGPCIFAGYCIRFRFKREQVLPLFIYYYTKTPRYQGWVRSIQRPAGQPNINKEEFKAFAVPLPPLAAQREMVAAMDAARQSRRSKLAAADDLLASMDEVILDHLGIVLPNVGGQKAFAVTAGQVLADNRLDPEYFHPNRQRALDAISESTAARACPLQDVVSFIRAIEVVSERAKYIGLASVESETGELVPSAEERAQGQCFQYQVGDVLFARLRPYLNKVYRAETGGTCSTEFHVLRARPVKDTGDRILPDYLASVLRSSLVLAQTKHMMTGNTHPRLSNDDVAKLLIPIPHLLEVQHRISEDIRKRREAARRLRAEADEVWTQAKAHFEAQLLGENE